MGARSNELALSAPCSRSARLAASRVLNSETRVDYRTAMSHSGQSIGRTLLAAINAKLATARAERPRIPYRRLVVNALLGRCVHAAVTAVARIARLGPLTNAGKRRSVELADNCPGGLRSVDL